MGLNIKDIIKCQVKDNCTIGNSLLFYDDHVYIQVVNDLSSYKRYKVWTSDRVYLGELQQDEVDYILQVGI